MPYFNFPRPFLANNYQPYRYKYTKCVPITNSTPKKDLCIEPIPEKNSKKNNSKENYFFELFGLKLYFDDVLIICLLFFLYQEGVKDEELFISLILLLLS